jgi:uncharacterized protein (DUF362 family)
MNRRNFIKQSLVTGAGVAAGLSAATFGGVARADGFTSRVSVAKGLDRMDCAFRSLQMFKKQIAAAIGSKRVVIKVNFVSSGTALACTEVAFVEGILEFLKSIGKRDVVIAEAGASSNTMNAYEQRSYWNLTKKYPVKLMDLNQEGFAEVKIWQYGNIDNTLMKTIRVGKMLMNPNNFIISAAPMKTHNTVCVTMSAKNVAMGAPLIDMGQSYSNKQVGSFADKTFMHGPGSWPGSYNASSNPTGTTKENSDYQVTNDNIYRLIKVYGIRPHLGIIDAFQGMQGEGPVSGSAIPTPQKLAVASLDFLAADRVGLALMGSNVNVPLGSTGHPFPACLNYLGQAGVGEWDLSKIEVLGEQIDTSTVYNYTAHTFLPYEIANIRQTPRD